MAPNPPAGWYPDPENGEQNRYWNGTQWTNDFSPKVPSTPSAPPSSPAFAAAVPQASPQEPATKKPFYRRWWVIALGAVVLLVIIASLTDSGSSGSNNGGSASGVSDTSKSPSSDSTATQKSSSSAKKTSKPKKIGLDADAGHANVVRAGSGFQLGDFKIQPGWTVKNEGYGLGYSVDGLTVQNTTDSSHTFDVEFKLRTGARISADITCFANEANPGDIVEVDCLPDGSGKPYKTITIENSI